MNKNKHLDLSMRLSIEQSLDKGHSFKTIGKSIEKDCTTISKEVRNHLVFEKKGAPYRPFNDCQNRKHCYRYGDLCPMCTHRGKRCASCGHCTSLCDEYVKEVCPKLDKPPYVCNGCSELRQCTLEKRFYKAKTAQYEYEVVRSESRSGFNLSESELAQLDSVISPLIKNGQSIHHILSNNQDLISCCEKTAYIYADNGLFSAKNIDMPRKVRFRPRKKKSRELKVDKAAELDETLKTTKYSEKRILLFL